MKRAIFAANWKMYKTPSETRDFFKAFLALQVQAETYFFPPALCVEAALQSVAGTSIQIGLQNSYFQIEGAFTGENSAATAQKMGCQAVLVGHSERRSLFSEDQVLSEKVRFAQSLGLKVVFCVGETAAERQAGQTERVIFDQLERGLRGASGDHLIVAYEPVWAIGTGLTATASQAEDAQKVIHDWLLKKGFGEIPLLYGGSVKPDNAAQLLSQPHISGFLVGGASLNPESFARICQAASA
jgi:triosephosphate isomerase